MGAVNRSTVRSRRSSSVAEKPLPPISHFGGASPLRPGKSLLRGKLPFALLLLLVGGTTVVFLPRKQASSALSSLRWAPTTSLQLDPRGRPIVDFESFPVPEEWSCNPFKEPGRLLVDVDEPVRRCRL